MAGFAIGPRRTAGGRPPVFRWECPCRERPFLLATYDADGRVNIKVRDRYWHVQGQVQAICPRCGAEHRLDLRGAEHGAESAEEKGERSEAGGFSGRR